MGHPRPQSSVLGTALILAFMAACSGGGESATGGGHGGADAGAPKLLVVPGAPAAPAKEPDSDDHAVDGYASAMAANGALAAIGTSTAVYRLDASGPVPLEIVGDGPNLPTQTGAVRAMAAYDDGILVAAEGGLFFTDGAALQLSLADATLGPLGITAMSVRVTPGDDGGAGMTHLAVIASEAAYEIEGGAMSKWTVKGESGAPTAVFALADRIVVSFGRRTYEIDKATKTAYPLAFDIGTVHEIACSSLACDEGSLLYFASDAGLVERGADGAYRLFPLAAAGDPAVPVETFALDATKQRLYAVAGTQVLRLHPGALPEAVATLDPATQPRHLVVDKNGDVWAGASLTVRRLAVGTPLSFATDVRPIFHAYCADCHATGSQGAPKRDFESYDVAVDRIDTVLMRVLEGSMPPVSYGKKLPKEDVQILQDWAQTKAP